jgi:putative DNA primase/helicase
MVPGMHAFEVIAAIIDAAVPLPPPDPVDSSRAAGRNPEARASAPPKRKQTARRRAAPAGPTDPSPVLDGAPGALPGPSAGQSGDLPASGDPPGVPAPPALPPSGDETAQSSQTGASSPDSPSGEGQGARGLGARRARRARARDADGKDALDRRLAYFPHTDLGNAERFAARFKGQLLWCDALGWMYWDGRRWCRDGANERVRRAAHECVRAIQDEAEALAASENDEIAKVLNEGKKNEREIKMSDLLSSWGRESESNNKINRLAEQASAYLSVPPAALDADPFKINCQNGTLVIRRGQRDGDPIEFWEHDPDDLITKMIPVDYDPDAECPRYDDFLAFVQPKPENRRFLHQWGGYSLTGDVSEQALLYLWGKGKNGKSTLVDVWGFVAGDYGRSVPIESFLDQGRGRNAGQATPDLAMLKAVRFLRTSEPEQNSKLAEALIKLVTGGEEFPVRELNMPYFMLQPQFKLTMSGNYRVKITGSDEGIWRRVALNPWTVTVPEEKRDKTLGEKLRREASGILNRLLDGLRDWLEHGLIRPEDTLVATAEYRKDSDPLGRFLEAAVVHEPGSRVQSSTMHEVFNAWGKCNGAAEWSNKGLTAALEERGFKRVHSNVMWWIDVKLTKTVGDYIDAQGKPRKVDDPNSGDAPPEPHAGHSAGGDDLAF